MTCPTSRCAALPVRASSSFFPFLSFCFLFVILACAGVWAQKDTGAIAGVVKDASGAVVGGVHVTVTDVDRGTGFSATTNAQGEYVASPLKVGRYTVVVEKAGFKKEVAGPVVVDVQARLDVDFTMQVGNILESITITTEGPQLQTATSSLGEVVDAQQATTLPLNGRNYAQLALLGAGVAPAEPGSRVSASYGFSSNGARSLQNNFLLDGVDNNSNLGDVLNEQAFVIQPSVDAIEEFKVQTNSYSAEFGRGNGAIMNAVIKSGTNSLHGDLYEFFRNDKLDGRNAFDTVRQPYKQNQFGFTIGGPIIKSRTFFFGDYEGLRIRQAEPFTGVLPTTAEVGGDFSANLDLTTVTGTDCNGQNTYAGEIFNTRLTRTSATSPTGFCGIPIGGYDASGHPTNVFPGVDPLAARLAALLPAAGPVVNGINFSTDPERQETRNNFDIRIDHKIGANDNAFGRFSYENQPSFIPPPFSGPSAVLDGGGFFDGNEDDSYRSLALSETHLFNSTVVNEFRLGYNRIDAHRFQLNSNQNVSQQLNFPGVPFGANNGGLPNITFSDGTIGIGSSTYLPSIEKQNSFVLSDNLTWIRGRHSVKYGAEVRIEEFTIFQPAESRGALTFGTEFTDNPANPGTGGASFATFLLGVPDGGGITSLHNIDYRRQIYAGYAQDDWKFNDRLTVNLGLRYEVFSTIKEHNNEEGTLVLASGDLLVPEGQNEPLTPTLAASIPIIHGSRGLISPDLHNFAPRIGFAYRMGDKLVLRSGYGIFYGGQENGPFSNPSPGFNPPFFSSEAFSLPCGNLASNPSITPGNALNCSVPQLNVNGSNALANGFPTNALSDPNSPELYSIQPNLRIPYNQQWHFGLEYQLPAETILDISYAGSHGLKLFGFYNGNQAVPTGIAPFSTLCAENGFTLLTCPNAPRRPLAKATPGLPAGSTCDLNNATDFQNCDPVFDVFVATFRSNDISNYNSLQVHFEKRPTHGLQFQASYTYAHALDDASSASLGSNNQGDFRLQNDPKLEYGNADFDVRQRLVMSYAYQLPFGKNKAVGGSATGTLDQIIGNWQVAGIVSASTGNWYTPTDSVVNLSGSDGGGSVFNSSRPDVVGNPNGAPCLPGTLFNTCAFVSNTVPGIYGDANRNIIRGPGYQNWDISLFKLFPISEAKRFEFRAEFFNAFNHYNPEFANPNTIAENTATILGSSTFGFATAARDPRFIQFALKFYF
jgi:Carboxypeptidase regulatory-like domain/TonB dependent receptor